MNSTSAVDLMVPFLRRCTREREDRMVVAQSSQNTALGNALFAVQGDEVRRRAFETLKSVHPIRDTDPRILLALHRYVPARPSAAILRHDPSVGVKGDLVLLVRDAPEDLALSIVRIGEQSQCLVAVTRKNHSIKSNGFSAEGSQFDPVLEAPDRNDGSFEVDAISKRSAHRFEVGAGSALDHEPLRASFDLQKAVVVEEAHKGLRGKLEHSRRAHRPHCGAHRQDVLFDELCTEPFPREVLAQCESGVLFVEDLFDLAIEPQDVLNHQPEARAQQVSSLTEESTQGAAVVLEAGATVADTEAHLRVTPGDTELAQDSNEVGVGSLIEHDEAGVYGRHDSVGDHVDGVRVSAEPGSRLEHLYIVVFRELPSRHQAGDSRADNRDLHGFRHSGIASIKINDTYSSTAPLFMSA